MNIERSKLVAWMNIERSKLEAWVECRVVGILLEQCFTALVDTIVTGTWLGTPEAIVENRKRRLFA